MSGLNDRQLAALRVLSEADRPLWSGRVGLLAGDTERPSWIVGHSWRNTLNALERRRLVRCIYDFRGRPGGQGEYEITQQGIEALRSAA